MKTPILLSVVAVVLVSSATAGGVKLITSADIKDGTIQTSDLSKKAREALKGRPAAPGAAPTTGPQGQPGSDGAVGPRGAPGSAGPAGAPGSTGPPGVAGSQGATGPTGPPGKTGDPATSLWAVVQGLQAPVLRAGSGVVSVANPEPAIDGSFSYDSQSATTKVTFDRDVSDCAYVATAGAADDAPLHLVEQQKLTGTVFVQPHWQPDYVGGVDQGTVSKDVTSVLVTVRAAAAPGLLGFHLAVFCPASQPA